MKFMMLVIPEEGYSTMPPGTLPEPEAIARMGKYNDELDKAGVLVSLYGLHVPAEGARVTFPGGKPKVQDGPFAEAKELVGGFWIIDVASREEAVEWARKVPPVENFTITGELGYVDTELHADRAFGLFNGGSGRALISYVTVEWKF